MARKKTLPPFEPLHGILEASQVEGVTEEAITDLVAYRAVIEGQTDVCSKNRSYDRLDEWGDAVHEPIHTMLEKYGFKNGKPEHKNNHTPNVRLWWSIYCAMGSVYYSRAMKYIGDHHSSAFERNEAWKVELDWLIGKLSEPCFITTIPVEASVRFNRETVNIALNQHWLGMNACNEYVGGKLVSMSHPNMENLRDAQGRFCPNYNIPLIVDLYSDGSMRNFRVKEKEKCDG